MSLPPGRMGARVIAGGAIASLLGITAAPGCGSQARPPELGSSSASSGSSDASVLVLGPDTSTPTCNLGPNGAVCSCVDQTLLGTPPNLYFVLDRSASMADDGKWRTIVDVLEELVIRLGPRISVGAAVFPDTVANGCTAGNQVFAERRGDAPAGQVGSTALALVATLERIGPAGGTPTAASLAALVPRIQSLLASGTPTYVVLATDGGPNCDSAASCNIAGCQLNIESDDGCAPQGPTNCCSPSVTANGGTACLDSGPTLQAVSSLAALGAPVYVVGIPGSAPYGTLLDELAIAGGTARTTEPLYYDVSTADPSALEQAMFKIAASVTGTCTFQLGAVPPDPSLVNVFLDEQPLPSGVGCVLPPPAGDDASSDGEMGADEDTGTGWLDGSDAEDDASVMNQAPADAAGEETGSDATADPDATPDGACNWTLRGPTVQILGNACASILSGDVLDVRVVAGCPTVIH